MSSNNSNAEMPPIGTAINKQIRIPQPNVYRDDKLHSNQLLFDHSEQFGGSKSMVQPPPTQILSSPPKYQPPPQPQGGILKNLTNQVKKRKTVGSTMDSNAPQQMQQQSQQHLMVKYPSDIQKSTASIVSDGQQQQISSSAIPIMARNNITKTISPKIPQFQRPPPPPMVLPPTNSTVSSKAESQIPNSNIKTQNEEFKLQNNFHHMYNPDPLRLVQKAEVDIGNLKVNTAGSSEGLSRLPPHAQNKHFQVKFDPQLMDRVQAVAKRFFNRVLRLKFLIYIGTGC